MIWPTGDGHRQEITHHVITVVPHGKKRNVLSRKSWRISTNYNVNVAILYTFLKELKVACFCKSLNDLPFYCFLNEIVNGLKLIRRRLSFMLQLTLGL